MSFRLASISLYLWFTLDSIRNINKFETIINIIASFSIIFKWIALNFSPFFDYFILEILAIFLPVFTIRSLSILKSIGYDDINNVSNSLLNDKTTFWDVLSNNSTKYLSVLFKTEFHCSIKPGDIPLIPGFLYILKPYGVIYRKIFYSEFLWWCS